MNIFVIPSWYPSNDNPSSGIFFREQTRLLATNHPDSNFGISTWGSHDHRLLIEKKHGISAIRKIFASKPSFKDETLLPNCIQLFTPAYTWTKKIFSGNLRGIIGSNLEDLRRFEKRFGKAEVIHAHVSYPAGYISMKISEAINVPFLITEHMSPFPLRDFRSNDGRVSNLVTEPLSKADKVISVSKALNLRLSKYALDVVTSFNFVDQDFFSTKSDVIDDGKIKIAAIGRLEPQKGFDVLLKAFSKAQFGGCTLSIMGSGSLENSLKNLVSQLGISQSVEFIDEGSQENVLNLLRRSNLLILSSLHENNPVVLIEAIACGKPIIATACGGPEDIVNETNGLLANVNDPQDLAKKMTQMIDNYDQYDPKKIRADFEKRFSSKVITPKIVALYKEVIAEHQLKVSGKNE